jgi:hypothetical protein
MYGVASQFQNLWLMGAGQEDSDGSNPTSVDEKREKETLEVLEGTRSQ